MQTQFFTKTSLSAAAHLLRMGELIAFPTETVYGLGADATNCQAVEKIFSVKGRPIHNPLIIHLASSKQIYQVTDDWNKSQQKLAEYFWPGPLTIITSRNSNLCPLVSAGLPSVAVRIPDHPLALELLALAGKPIAAPSANLSSRPSPTTVDMVNHDLKGKIAGILADEQSSSYGLESSVVKIEEKKKILFLLREGSLTKEELQEALPDFCIKTPHPKLTYNSPGTRYAHYRPNCPVNLFPLSNTLSNINLDFEQENLAIFSWKGSEGLIKRMKNEGWENLHEQSTKNILLFVKKEQKISLFVFKDLQEYAQRYYLSLFESERRKCQIIIAQESALTGIGRALQNRLLKSSQKD